MDREALEALFNAENVDSSAYSLDGGMPIEAYVLKRRPSDWAVYYSERGLRSGDAMFETEDEACAHSPLPGAPRFHHEARIVTFADGLNAALVARTGRSFPGGSCISGACEVTRVR